MWIMNYIDVANKKCLNKERGGIIQIAEANQACG